MAFKDQDIIEVIERVVSEMRETQSYIGIFNSGITTCTVYNTLREMDVITINNVDYAVNSAAPEYFTVKGDVSAHNTYTPKAPYFEYGHILEVSNKLKDIDTATGLLKFQKYPLIVLHLDTRGQYRNKQSMVFPSVSIFILNITDKTYRAKDRRENNFKPILTPLYEKFMTKLRYSLDIEQHTDNFNHDKYDRFFWGSQTNGNSTINIFNDYLDAVEIENLSLNINVKNCNHGSSSNM